MRETNRQVGRQKQNYGQCNPKANHSSINPLKWALYILGNKKAQVLLSGGSPEFGWGD